MCRSILSTKRNESIGEIRPALLTGVALVMIPKETLLSSEKSNQCIRKQEATPIGTVPSFLGCIDFRLTQMLEWVLLGGESCPIHIIKKFLHKIDIYNGTVPPKRQQAQLDIKSMSCLMLNQPYRLVSRYRIPRYILLMIIWTSFLKGFPENFVFLESALRKDILTDRTWLGKNLSHAPLISVKKCPKPAILLVGCPTAISNTWDGWIIK